MVEDALTVEYALIVVDACTLGAFTRGSRLGSPTGSRSRLHAANRARLWPPSSRTVAILIRFGLLADELKKFLRAREIC